MNGVCKGCMFLTPVRLELPPWNASDPSNPSNTAEKVRRPIDPPGAALLCEGEAGAM